MTDTIKVCLDTNVIILGERSMENRALVRLFSKGLIRLFVSDKVYMERHERSSRQQKKLAIIVGQENQLGRDKFYKLYWSALKKRDELKKLEEKEIEFWRQVRLESMHSTFRGIIWLGIQGPDYARLFDAKNDCGLLDDLLTNRNITKADAFHIMEAHSAAVDYLLTWDRKLISKANRIAWLKPKLMTPLEFIKICETEENLWQS